MNGFTRALTFGLLAFALLFGLGEALAADVPSASDSDNTLGATVASNAPEISAFQITDAVDTDFLHGQLDVQTTYYFNVTVGDDNGWSDLQWINIRVWYDGGSSEIDFSSQTTGANYRLDLNYTNVAPLDSPATDEWSVAEGNLAYNASDSQIFTNTANQNYTFKLSFQLNAQVRQADDPVNAGTSNYDDLGSWNVEIRAKDTDNADVIDRTNVTGVYHEVGVFQYTSVSIASNWDAGSIAPGSSGTSSGVAVTHQSNRAYDLSVWFDSHLTSGGNTIDVSNINITAAGDTNDDITADTSFAGLTSTNAVIIRNDTSNGTHETDANSTTTNVQFRVFVPFGTPSGSYTASLTIRVEQP